MESLFDKVWLVLQGNYGIVVYNPYLYILIICVAWAYARVKNKLCLSWILNGLRELSLILIYKRWSFQFVVCCLITKSLQFNFFWVLINYKKLGIFWRTNEFSILIKKFNLHSDWADLVESRNCIKFIEIPLGENLSVSIDAEDRPDLFPVNYYVSSKECC